MFPELFSIGPLTLRTYGLMVALGFLAGLGILRRALLNEGIEERHVDRLFWLAFGFGILGSRLLYALSNPFEWGDFFKLWEGGLSFTGGLLAAGGAVFFYLRKAKLPVLAVTDAFAVALPVAHAIGRLGCLAVGCCWGTPSGEFFGISFHDPRCMVPVELLGVRLHPVALYESLGLLAIAFLVKTLKRRWPGRMVGVYGLSYAILRFTLEFWRADAALEPSFLGLTFTQNLMAWICLPLGIVWIAAASPRKL
ncbi:MAG: prolipoprotein diacylglyceryl transferase [Elusimicrobia bacterium]|nr:prolipoprotein diacylglyceryl transferase [Elusimicrobiota bacterium]